jgi:iron complex outermembrane receptor protein
MRNSQSLACGSAVIALLWAGGALAQTAPGTQPDSTDVNELEEIVVTAQKREERLVDVPVAVSAIGGEALLNAQIRGVEQLSQAVPSLTFTQSTNDLNNNVRVRGVGTALFNVGLESSVSFVVDGVVLSRQGQGFQDLIDIERVEVLRGPQGTLFGKNATAGVINVITQRPSDELTFQGEAVVAGHEEYRLRGSVSGPLAPTLGGRLTAYYNDVGGHIENLATGINYNGGESYGLRGKLQWEPSAELDVLLIADYRKSEADCCQFQARSFANPVARALLAPVTPGPENDQVSNDGATFNNTEAFGVSLQADVSLGDHTLTSISAYRTWDFLNNIDVDGVNNPQPLLLAPLVPTFIGQFNVNGGPTEIRQFSQELRLTSPGGGALEYVVGLYYFSLDLDRGFQRRVALCLPTPANAGLAPGAVCRVPQFRSTSHIANTKTDNFAAFGQAELEVTDRLSVLGGLRLQYEEVSYIGNRPSTGFVPGDVALLTGSAGSGSVDDTDLSGKLGLQYRLNPNAQAYATYTRGYKGQGYDVEVTANFADQAPVRPETVDAYELGYKAVFADGRLSANIALFHAEYQDLQVQASTVVNGLNQFVATNAGTSTTRGLEVEATARPVRGLTLSGGFTLLDAQIDAPGLNCNLTQVAVILGPDQPVPANTCFRLTGQAAALNRQNVEGGDLPNAPDLRANLTARYETPLGSTGYEGFVQGFGGAPERGAVLARAGSDQPAEGVHDGRRQRRRPHGGWPLSADRVRPEPLRPELRHLHLPRRLLRQRGQSR